MAKTKAQIAKEVASHLERIAIVWRVVPNEHKARGGWMPVYEKNGKQYGSTYGTGYDKAEARRRAEAMAHDEAAHYSGDWHVTVTEGK